MQTRKILALLLALGMLLGILSGCGSTTASSGTEAAESAASSDDVSVEEKVEDAETTPEETDAEGTDTEDEEDAEEAEEDEAVASSPTGGLVLPLSEDGETLTEWWGGFEADLLGITNPAETLVAAEAEKRTGVHVEYTVCSSSAVNEVASIMYASGNYADIIAGGMATYIGGFEKGVEDDIYLELNDLMDEGYTPNYKAVLESDPTVAKDAGTDSGKYIAFWQISDNPQWPWSGVLCRGDWLEDLNLEVPVTYDELHDVLTAFKSEKNATYPLFVTGSSNFTSYGNYVAGFGVGDSWMQVDGEVKYGPVEDGYRDYLALMQQWYSEGLIDPDFVSTNVFNSTNIANSVAGVFIGNYTDCDAYATTIEGSRVIGIPQPRVNADDEIHIGQVNPRVSSKWVTISTACENPELAAQWIDYFYSEEGSLLNNYGIEGETFEFDENGDPQLTELVTNNPDYSFQMSMWRYIDGGPGVRLYIWERELAVVSADGLACEDAWTHDGAYMISDLVTPTAEESAEQNSIMGDIKTYVDEMKLKFITGQESLDYWDSYCDYIWGLGLQDAIDIEQDVLDRYNAR